MEALRERLIAKIDGVLDQVALSDETPLDARLQLAANLRWPSNSSSIERQFVLDEIDVGNLRQYRSRAQSPSTAAFPHGLPSPLEPLVPNGAPFLDSSEPFRPTPAFSYGSTALVDLRQPAINNLHIGPVQEPQPSPQRSPSPPPQVRQFESDERHFPKRRKQDKEHPHKLEQSTIDKLIEGIWEQIHNPKCLAMGDELKETMNWVIEKVSGDTTRFSSNPMEFSHATRCCRQITTNSRTARAFEVIVQAHWIDCYDARIKSLHDERSELRPADVKKIVMAEACTSFSWTEKELRNRMAIWKGYREIKDAAGWTALIFAGPGIYRFCKYRLGFDQDALAKLKSIRTRAEVAADTLQPQWRQLLSLVGEPTQIHWKGHPHDWAVSKRKDPLPLAFTYRQWNPDFKFTHLEDSIIDTAKFGDKDPRRFEDGPDFYCKSCSLRQSTLAEENECECFPELYSPNPRTPCPVQVYQTDVGKNNGLIACCTFERNHIVGEFVGLVTKDLAGVDVMQSQAGDNEPYQIHQGEVGNYTRFINHSCQPNCQFQTFSWLGIQRIVVVSKGVPAGKELTVDYSGRYWQHLDKVCLCGEARCRYKDRLQAPNTSAATS